MVANESEALTLQLLKSDFQLFMISIKQIRIQAKFCCIFSAIAMTTKHFTARLSVEVEIKRRIRLNFILLSSFFNYRS